MAYVSEFIAIPDGFSFKVAVLHAARPREIWTEPEVRVAYADGRWGDGDDFEDRENSLVVRYIDGPRGERRFDGGISRWHASIWVGPLPPDEDVEIEATRRSSDRVINPSGAVPGGPIREAAPNARDLWPNRPDSRLSTLE